MLVDFLVSVGDFLLFLVKTIITCAVVVLVAVVVPLIALKNLKSDDKQENDPSKKLNFIDLKQLAKNRKKLIKSKLKDFNPDHKLEKQAKRLGLDKDDKKDAQQESNSSASETNTTQDKSSTLEDTEQQNTTSAHAETSVTADVAKTNATVDASADTYTKTSATVDAAADTDTKTDATSTEDSPKAESVSKVEPSAEQSSEPMTQDKQSVNSSATTSTQSNLADKPSPSKCPFKCSVAKISGLMQKKKSDKEKNKTKFLDKQQERAKDISALELAEQNGEFCPQNLYVIEFSGSTAAKEVAILRLQIDAILDVATDKDEVILKLESPGGSVTGYGLCATQLARIRNRGIHLTVVIDEVAASGGYMMACVANKIISAPFAYIGSVGVVGTLPNVHNLAKRFGVDIEQHTAGKYKRTLTMVGENTEEGRQKFKEELSAVHNLFKAHIQKYRPELDIENVATGEAWLALDALKLGLIDEIAASDDYIQSRIDKTYNAALKIEYSSENKGKLSALRKLLPKFKFNINVHGLKVDDLSQKLNELQDESFRNIR